MRKKTAKITIMNKSTRARSINQIFGIDESLFQTQKIRPTVKAKIFVNYNKTVYFAPNKSNGQNPSQLIFIPCINCGNDIAVNEVEKHSMICTFAKKNEDETNNNDNGVYQINYKIRKLKEHIKSIMDCEVKTPPIFKENFDRYSSTLIEMLSESLSCDKANLQNVKKMKISLKKIENIRNLYGNDITHSVLIDRCSLLITEKISEYRKMLRSKNNDSHSLIAVNKIDEIISDVDTNNAENSSQNTSMSNSLTNNNVIDFNVESFLNDEHKMKSEFYKAVLKLKFEKFHSSHKGQKITQKELYNEAKKLKIPKEKWNDFIIEELNNPNKYFMANLRNSRDRYTLAKTLDVIKEE